MKLLTAAAATLFATSAFAADVAKTVGAPPPPKPLLAWPEPNLDFTAGGFDYAAGVKLQSNYVSRGISQTANRPSATAYGELRYGWLYAGVQAWNVNLPTQPMGEVDVYGGVRPVWGPLTLDVGVIGYLYPGNKFRYYLGGAPAVSIWALSGGIPTTSHDPSFMEIYGKATWQINDWIALGGALYYSPNWNNYKARALYSELNAKLTVPDTGFALSGAFGHAYLGRSNNQYGWSYVQPFSPLGFKFASYNTWNVGASYTYKAATFDLRYHGSSLGKVACAINTSDPAANLSTALFGFGQSSWCGHKFVAGVSIDLSSATFK